MSPDKDEPVGERLARQEERLAALRRELNGGLATIREDIAEMRKDQAVRAKDRRTMLLTIAVAAMGLVGTFIEQLLQAGRHP